MTANYEMCEDSEDCFCVMCSLPDIYIPVALNFYFTCLVIMKNNRVTVGIFKNWSSGLWLFSLLVMVLMY